MDEPKEDSRFTFYESFLDSIEEFKPMDQLKLYQAIARYGIHGEEPKFSKPGLNATYKMIKKSIDRCKVKQRNGSKGGAPAGNQNARKVPADSPDLQRVRGKPSIEDWFND